MQPNICNGRAEFPTRLQLLTRRFVLSPLKIGTLTDLKDTQLQFVRKGSFISTTKPLSCSCSTSVSPPTGKEECEVPNPFIVSYFINSCGLTPEKAVYVASGSGKLLRFKNPEGPDKVLEFFRNQGFTDTHITKIVNRQPSLLVYRNPQEQFLPKLEFFRSIGFSESQLLHFLSQNPNVLGLNLEDNIIPTYDFLKSVLLSNEKVINCLRRGCWILPLNLSNYIKPNIEFLSKIGVSASHISMLLRNFPETLLIKPAELCKYVDELREVGFDLSKSMFVAGLHVISHKANRSLRERCVKIYKLWGWTDDDILSAFRKFPQCMLVSEKKITQIMDLLVNKMGRQPGEIAKFPNALGYNYERRIVRRCAVIRVLQAKGLVKDDWKLSSVLLPSEKIFVMKFVTKFKEQAPELLSIYEGTVDVFEE